MGIIMVLFLNFLKFDNSKDQELKDLTFKILKILKDLNRKEVCIFLDSKV